MNYLFPVGPVVWRLQQCIKMKEKGEDDVITDWEYAKIPKGLDHLPRKNKVLEGKEIAKKYTPQSYPIGKLYSLSLSLFIALILNESFIFRPRKFWRKVGRSLRSRRQWKTG